MTIDILSGNESEHIQQAAQALQAGQLVVLPTETVYGLGADADQDSACQKVFKAKDRPANHPLIVHVSSMQAAMHYVDALPPFAKNLMSVYWPGPLTVIVKRKKNVGTAAAGGQDTIGLRCPSHPIAQQLLQAFEQLGGHGIAAPSANRFGKTSPTTAQHAQQAFADVTDHGIAMILDGGGCEVGIESTIIDCSRSKPVLLRPGILTLDALENAAQTKITLPQSNEANALGPTPKASGTLESHYAPKAIVRLMSAADIVVALGMVAAVKSPKIKANPIGVYARELPKAKVKNIIKRQMPNNAKEVAHELYAVLHDFDAQDVGLLWVETPPDDNEWSGVRDRLERASKR